MIDTAPLFQPFRLNSITLPNRFILPGMQRRRCDEDGGPTDQLTEYYRRRVQGGVAMIITESLGVDDPSVTQSAMFARLNAKTLDTWTRCAGAIRDAGGNVLFQLWHEGAIRKEGGDGPYAHYPTLSPSGLAFRDKKAGRAATGEELDRIADAFIRCAIMARRAGANGVEVHSAHGYLLDQFLWAVTNERDDGFGGADILDRVKFPARIVRGIRAECGADFVISFRFSQWKEADYEAKIAHSPEELGAMLGVLRAAGVDLFHASTRRFWLPEWEGSSLNLAGWTKKLAQGAAVATVGSVGLTTDIMETIFGQEAESRVEAGVAELAARVGAGEFDLAAVGRSLIGDPDWVNKVRDGRFSDIVTFRREHLGKLGGEMSLVEEAHGKKVPRQQAS